ncbi:MAG: S8 family serine peptidase, partial [Chthoniobacterales bacterium]|nr:S8 family serine peptidase [Chthoniobacterales bacterium]
AVAPLLIALIFWKESSSLSKKKEIADNKLSHAPLPLHSTTTKKSISLATPTLRPSLHGIPAPMQEPSEEEFNFYPGAVVTEAAEVEGSQPHEKIRYRILKTAFTSRSTTSGMIRTEEIVDDKSGELIDREEMLADHLLVKLPIGEDPQHFLECLDTIASNMNKVTPEGFFYDLTLRSSSLDAIPEALEKIALLDGVRGEPVFMVHSCSSNVPSYLPSFWNLEHQWGLWSDCGGIDAYDAWQVEPPETPSFMKDATLPIVAVLDSGIRFTHEDLRENIWSDPAEEREESLHGIDMIDKNDQSMDNSKDGHGTHVAGIIGGIGISKNYGLQRGTFGVAPKVKLMSCRFMMDTDKSLGVGTESDLICCIDYAIRHGASILNCSFVMTHYLDENHITPNARGDYNKSYFSENSSLLLLQLQKAQEKGVIIVAAAGNAAYVRKSYSDPSSIPEPPKTTDSTITQTRESSQLVQKIQYNNDQHPIYPANYGVDFGLDNIISVAASTFSWFSMIELSLESNYGSKNVHIAAPGCDILSTSNKSDSSYVSHSGTSMAAPFVTGSLALLKKHYPQASYQSLIKHLLANADHSPGLKGKIIDQRHLNVGRALTTPLCE